MVENNLLRMSSAHWRRVRDFMLAAGQDAPSAPSMPTIDVRRLRVSLLLEEVFELAAALNVKIRLNGELVSFQQLQLEAEVFDDFGKSALAHVADAFADISVVNVGGMIACGMADKPLLEAVDVNNLQKIARGTKNPQTGKFEKPADHKPPDFALLLYLMSR